jgi:hypothetical protein
VLERALLFKLEPKAGEKGRPGSEAAWVAWVSAICVETKPKAWENVRHRSRDATVPHSSPGGLTDLTLQPPLLGPLLQQRVDDPVGILQKPGEDGGHLAGAVVFLDHRGVLVDDAGDRLEEGGERCYVVQWRRSC